jgi:hypothetical protein
MNPKEWNPTFVAGVGVVLAFLFVRNLFLSLLIVLPFLLGVFVVTRAGVKLAQRGRE